MRWMRFGRTQSETRAGRRVRPAAGSLVVGGVCALLVAILALGAASASAEPLCEDTWTGPAEGEWTTEADWSSGKVPTSASVACIGSGKTVTVRFSGSVAGVVQGEGSVVISGGSLEVASALEPSAIAHLSVTGGELVGSGEVNVTHSFSGGGGEAKLAGSGPVVIESGATGTVSSSLRLNNVTLKNAGTLSVGAEAEEGASIDGEGHAVLTNSGTLIANTAANAFANSPESKLVNTGILKKTKGARTTDIGFPVDNEGTVSAASGKLAFLDGGTAPEHAVGSWSSSGTEAAILFEDESFTLGETANWEGNIELGRGARIKVGKVEAASGSVTLNNDGYGTEALELTGSSVSNIENLTLAAPEASEGPVVKVTDELDVTGSFSGGGTWKLAGPGTFVIESGATGTVSSHLGLSGITLKNLGILTVAGAEGSATIAGVSKAILANSGTLILNTKGRMLSANESGGLTLVNSGTVKKTEGSWTTQLEAPVENLGVIRAEVGRFEILNPITSRSQETLWGGPESGSTTPGQIKACAGDPVSCATGNDTETQTDFAIGGRGVGLDLTRTYNSQAGAEGVKGIFGYGWTSSFSDHLVVEKTSKKATLHQANGSTVAVHRRGGESFTAPNWSQDTLSGSKRSGYTLTLANQTNTSSQGSERAPRKCDRSRW